MLDGLMLLTTDDCKLVRLFPRLPDEIKGEGRVPSYEAIKYLEEVTSIKLLLTNVLTTCILASV